MVEAGTCDGSGSCKPFANVNSDVCQGCGARRVRGIDAEFRQLCSQVLEDGVLDVYEWRKIEAYRQKMGVDGWKSALFSAGIISHRVGLSVSGALATTEGARAEVIFQIQVCSESPDHAVRIADVWLSAPAEAIHIDLPTTRAPNHNDVWESTWVRQGAKFGDQSYFLNIRIASRWGEGCFEEWRSERIRIEVGRSTGMGSVTFNDYSAPMAIDGREGVNRGNIEKTINIGQPRDSVASPQPTQDRPLVIGISSVTIRPRVTTGLYRISVGSSSALLAIGDGIVLGNPAGRTQSYRDAFPQHLFVPCEIRAADGSLDVESSRAVSRRSVRLDIDPEQPVCRVVIMQSEVPRAPAGPCIDGRRVSTGTTKEILCGQCCEVAVGLPGEPRRGSLGGAPMAASLSPVLVGLKAQITAFAPYPFDSDYLTGASLQLKKRQHSFGSVLLSMGSGSQATPTTLCWLLSSIRFGAALFPHIRGGSLHFAGGRLWVVVERGEMPVRELPVDGTSIMVDGHEMTCIHEVSPHW